MNQLQATFSSSLEAAAEEQATRFAAMVPEGYQLCPCPPFVVVLDSLDGVAVTGTDLARHAGLEELRERRRSDPMPRHGEFSGAIVHAEFHASIEVSGKSRFPRLEKLFSRRPRALPLTDHESVLLRPLGNMGRVMLRPYRRSSLG